jgi:hypothetical protein
MLHQDGDGVGMVRDRVRRSAERRELAEVAHAAREVGDIFAFGLYRARLTLDLANQDHVPLDEYIRSQEPFQAELHAAIESWWTVERQYSGCRPAPLADEEFS